MSHLKWPGSCSIFFFFISFASYRSFSISHKCSPQQTLALLLFKQNLSSINFLFDDPPYYNSPCQDWLGSNYHPIMMDWNMSTDCCTWDGITCNYFTGDVIGIDLSCGMLRGSIHPNSTIFHLPYLERLNLAYNDLTTSQIPREIGRFSNSFTHLNISRCGFTGDISSRILSLTKLVSLDLSQNHLRLQPSVLKNLLQNSTHLRDLLISGVHVGWILPAYLNISSSLKSLDFSGIGLLGKLPGNIFNLCYLEKLYLSYNHGITGPLLPQVNKSINIPLKWLDLSYNSLSEIPHSIGHLKSLNHLDLSFTNISQEIPDSIGHLTSLNYLHISFCGLVGSIPKSLGNLGNLITLDLSYNKLQGTLPSFLFTSPFLENILLDGNMFSGGLPSQLFNIVSLKRLSLSNNHFDVEINEGFTSPAFIRLISLTYIDLSCNNLTGVWELDTLLSRLQNLTTLHLSYSGLSVITNNSTSYVTPNFRYLGLASCKLTVFPESLRSMKNLLRLDLSNNNIHGHIPTWAGEIGGNGLNILNLSHNFITGLPQFQWGGLVSLYIQSNQIQGPFPPSICDMRNLLFLDMSNNRFDGMIPQCVGNVIASVQVIDMGNNQFHGTIPDVNEDCTQLNGLILNRNQLEGEVPCSLSKCVFLGVLDLGNNNLTGTFPGWLGDLPFLQVLILRSNNLNGSIETCSTILLPFPSLRVLDLSHNGFVGHLPGKYFQNFNAMKIFERISTPPQYMHIGSKYYSMIIAMKGALREFPQISVHYVVVDLSNNEFEGEIPSIIAFLASLIVLDLSHNNLSGQIPYALGSLSTLESLDLSWNQLTGKIPQSLADLTFLGFLNLSQNRLVGRIPTGTQLSTFETSFGGNLELCGLPLPKKCEQPREPQLEANEDKESGFTWRVVMYGYGCGTLLGLVIGYFMLSTGRPKWFNAIVDAGENIIHSW